MNKYEEAKCLFHHNNITFEQERFMNEVIDEALEIANKAEQAEEFAYYNKEKIHTKCCWCICDESGSDCEYRYKKQCEAIDVFYEAYTQALEYVKGDNND